MKLLRAFTWNRFAVTASIALTLVIVLAAMFDRDQRVRAVLDPVGLFLVLSLPMFAPVIGGLLVLLVLLAVPALVAMLGRIHKDAQARRDLMLRGLCVVAPFGVWELARVTHFADRSYLARHRECLEAAVAGRPAAHTYGEVDRSGRCTVIFATNYDISDVYWVIHLPPEATAEDRAGAEWILKYSWHVEGPWYVAFH